MTRKEAIKELVACGYWKRPYRAHTLRRNEALRMAIEALKKPDVPDTNVEKWISASEKLPEYGESVLVWDGSCYSVGKRIPYITGEDGEHIEGDWWVSDDYDEELSEYYPNLRDGICVAWMPLPEPYRKEDD